MDDRAVLSAVEGVDGEKLAVGLPLKPSGSLPRRVSTGNGRSRPASHGRASKATVAAVFQVIVGVVLGVSLVLLARSHLNFQGQGTGHDDADDLKVSAGPKNDDGDAFEIQTAPPHAQVAASSAGPGDDPSATATVSDDVAELTRKVNDAKETTSRLWTLIDALRDENLATKSLLKREACDAETLGPICASLGNEPAASIPASVRTRTSDLRLRRLWGTPSDDPSPKHPTELLVITVGKKMMDRVNQVVQKFDKENTQVVLFHYDGNVDVWDDTFPEWSKSAIHVSAHKQSKWWFAKRFLHPDIVEPYERVWIWDEDIDVSGGVGGDDISGGTVSSIKPFDPKEYVRIVKEHGLEISQPALISGKGAWPITRRVVPRQRNDGLDIRHENGGEGSDGDDDYDGDSDDHSTESTEEIHRHGVDWRGQACVDANGDATNRPPCAAYVEIMGTCWGFPKSRTTVCPFTVLTLFLYNPVPVFSKRAWRCVWSLIQNDLTHGWGLDLTWHACAADPFYDPTDPAHNRTAVDNMAIVDAQGVVHLGEPTLGEQGESSVSSVSGFQGVQRRRAAEWDLFNQRWKRKDLGDLFDLEQQQGQAVEEAMRRLMAIAGTTMSASWTIGEQSVTEISRNVGTTFPLEQTLNRLAAKRVQERLAEVLG
jgi:hypothetical protein